MDTHVLGLFAKKPEQRLVKTRLAAATSATWAMEVATAFLLDSVQRTAALAVRRVLVFAPEDAASYFIRIADGQFALSPQSQGDLGERMTGFFAEQFAGGASRVVLLGTDSPTLPPSHIERAFAELTRADVVVGPATDGGYYLIGLQRPMPDLFAGIAWGTNQVLEQTIHRVRDSGRRLALLPPWYDVDTLDDWRMFRGHVAALRCAGVDPAIPHTEQLLKHEGP
jgi:rSAM/selenodomain-associated transferase 1